MTTRPNTHALISTHTGLSSGRKQAESYKSTSEKVNRIVYSHTIINSFVKECDNFSREANPIPPRRSHTEWLLALALAESFSARQNTCRRGSLVCFGRSTIRSYHTRGGARSYHWPWPRTERVRLFADAYPVSVTLGAISWVE